MFRRRLLPTVAIVLANLTQGCLGIYSKRSSRENDVQDFLPESQFCVRFSSYAKIKKI